MNKALLIGGFGNIGLAVTKEFLKENFDVTVVTSQERTVNPVSGVRVVVANRKDDEAFRKKIDGSSFDYVVDFASFTKEDAKQDYEMFSNVKRLIALSSGACYGPLYGSEVPILESMNRNPSWKYGVIKKEMEDYFFDKYYKTGYPVTIFRPSVTYARQKTIVRQIGSDNSWIDRIRKGKPIVTGNPYILRSFLFADDAGPAFTGALKHDCTVGQVYNLGAMKPYDWGTYHRTMMKVLGKEVEMVEVPLSVLQASPHFQVSEMITESYVFNAFYSGEKIARDIPEFSPKTSLEDGLRNAVNYLDENNLIPNSDELTWEDELIEAQRSAVIFFDKFK